MSGETRNQPMDHASQPVSERSKFGFSVACAHVIRGTYVYVVPVPVWAHFVEWTQAGDDSPLGIGQAGRVLAGLYGAGASPERQQAMWNKWGLGDTPRSAPHRRSHGGHCACRLPCIQSESMVPRRHRHIYCSSWQTGRLVQQQVSGVQWACSSYVPSNWADWF